MSTEKKLPASAKRLQELRGKGNVPKSAEITTTAVLAVFLFGLLYFGGYFAGEMARFMTLCFMEIGKSTDQISVLGAIPTLLNSRLILAMVVLSLALISGVVFSHVLQTGFIFSPGRLGQNGLEILNPSRGIQTLFSMQRLVMTGSSVIKLFIILGFAYNAVKEMIQYNVFTGPVTPQELGMFYAQAAWAVGWRVLVALTLMATADFIYQKWQYSQDNRMTVQEVRDEQRQVEGSLETKQKMRGMARKILSMKRMMENMTDATIVITNPTHYAVALRYERNVTPAPVVIAKGMNRNARRIRERAEQLGVALQENKTLAQGFYKHGQVGKPIPVIYFQAVANLLVELYRRGYRRI